MKTFKYILVFTLQFLLCTICFAQNQQLTFSRVPPPSGVNPASKAGVQDRQGYMWIGTYQAPLRRYDGYHYTFYSNDPLDSNSLAENWVEALYAGRNGAIWVGTASHGFDRLDPTTGHFKHFRHDPKADNSLSDDNVTALLEDREGMLWIGTGKGLNRYDSKTGKFQRYYYQPDDPFSLSCDRVVALYEDKQGTIWVGTGDVWHSEEGETDEGGLNRLDKKTGKFIRYVHDPNNPHSLINNKVKAIFEDSRGTFWVGTAGDGLHTMDRANGTFHRHLYDPLYPEKLSRPPQKKIRPSVDDYITFIIEDSAGAIWIGTFGNGINRYDPGTNKAAYYPLFKDSISGVRLEVPWWACNTRDGMLWIGYWRGLYRIDPLRKNIPYVATGTSVEEIYEDKFGVLWYGTDEGLVRKDRRTGTGQRFVYDPKDPYSISNNRIDAIYEDRQGELWIGTGKGLDRFDRKTGAFVHHVFNPAIDSILKGQRIQSIYEDKEGSLWYGFGEGLIRNNRQKNTISYYHHDPNDSNTLSQGDVMFIYEDKSGNLWLGTFGGTLNRLSPQTGKIRRFLNGVNIHRLWQDSEGVLWVGTSIGLYRSNPSLSSFSRFTGPNGEFAGNIIVNGVLEDDQKNLWVNASVGICRLNAQRNKVIIFGRHNDPTWYNGTGCYKGKNGELFFGGGSGYFTFFPHQLAGNAKPPQIVLSAFRIADQPVVPGKESPLKEPLSQTKEISLNYNQNVFSFDFAGIHYSNPEQNRHLFMLEGLDKAWRKAGEEKIAYYYNVPPGHYVFRVKASNRDGVWAEKSIGVIVSRSWWSTWWFRITVVLSIAALFYTIIRWRLHQKFSLQVERSEKEKQLAEMRQKTAELQQQTTELEMQALRAQMNPHFIFNSLNSINRFILKNDKAKASEYLTKFSRLVRLILQNSAASLIPLESELESLRLYLELEAVRFDHHFDYKIIVNDDLDVDILKVPPLIIQPYAENAIWHGLMHKEEKGHLEIELYQCDEVLCCKITDDGVGRQRAAKLKSKSASTHKSMGMRITADRIAMLQQKKQIDTTIQITDLVLPDGSAGGTEVLLKVPVMI